MKIKNLMKFYFFADSLNRALDGVIMRVAFKAGRDAYRGGEAYFNEMAAVVEIKGELSDFWARLDGIMEGLTERDRRTLKVYAAARTAFEGEGKREVHRALVKFSRRAKGLLYGDERQYKLMCAYKALLVPAPD